MTPFGQPAPRNSPGDECVRVDLGRRSYDIVIGERLLARAGDLILPLLAQGRVIVVSDESVANLHLGPLAASLGAAGIAHQAIVLPAGEQTKDFAHLRGLCEQHPVARHRARHAADRARRRRHRRPGRLRRRHPFAGLDFVQAPTTLLAQVDSSVGGKTGINTPQGKNLVGLFHQPRLVLADVDTLKTLDARQMRAGYAEIVKYGLLGDQSFFEWLEAKRPARSRGGSRGASLRGRHQLPRQGGHSGRGRARSGAARAA